MRWIQNNFGHAILPRLFRLARRNNSRNVYVSRREHPLHVPLCRDNYLIGLTHIACKWAFIEADLRQIFGVSDRIIRLRGKLDSTHAYIGRAKRPSVGKFPFPNTMLADNCKLVCCMMFGFSQRAQWLAKISGSLNALLNNIIRRAWIGIVYSKIGVFPRLAHIWQGPKSCSRLSSFGDSNISNSQFSYMQNIIFKIQNWPKRNDAVCHLK